MKFDFRRSNEGRPVSCGPVKTSPYLKDNTSLDTFELLSPLLVYSHSVNSQTTPSSLMVVRAYYLNKLASNFT